MSLRTCEQRALDRIEKTLQAGDPRLGSLFVIFTRLMQHEAMPRTERVKAGLRKSLNRKAGVPIAVIAILSVLMLSSLTPGRHACGATPAARGYSQSSGHVRGCLPGPAMAQARQYAR